ncbi:cytochrome c biogenesis protein CcdA [Prevotella sp. S7 MS 2]|uniref:protein-disulfide reductase DsbD family protein n=1 Tax=Prevotella sp. S7 MS 2 TaxID=1287488 RepID=UPI000513F5D7|nr:cytochrome c biogenesis protein CcdA [Prevotella sp. S7 MS 2]KGI60477.1 thiol:disulfide interchange protein [Prevotella sp. S7 MS 2]
MNHTHWKSAWLTLFLAIFTLAIHAQIQEPVHFSVQQKQVSPTEVDLVFTGKIDAGWHVYSTGLPSDGPISASLAVDKAVGVQKIGKLQARGKEISTFDKLFEMNLRYFEHAVTFVQKFKITGKTYEVKGSLEYGACNDQNCLPPTQVDYHIKGNGPADAPETADVAALVPANQPKADSTSKVQVAESTKADSIVAAAPVSNVKADLWKPVIKELKKLNGDTAHQSWFYIFFMGFVGGLLALFTPCVWPIIPMTVSFFLKRAGDKSRGVRDAVLYGISIIVIYLSLGLIVTGLFGASSLNALATDAGFNIFFFLMLVVFALSFFGWFELTLPSSWTNSVDSKASNTSGILSIFLMAFTLALVSFSCTGPIIGFLLVEVSNAKNILGPAIGMFGFALALALPFTLFALFPTWLNKAPKSGGWMNIIKVTLGFIELAFSLKFFSVADMAYGWHLLDREVFLSLWIVIFGLLGLYLIGKLKFPHDDQTSTAMPVPCIMLGLVSLSFAVYMVPGLWGAPLKAVSAFAPPMFTQDFNLYHNEVRAQYTDYEEGMAAAAAQGKPVMIDFTGFGCTNCRNMELAVWTDPVVADKLKKDYILISLYVDDRKPLAEPMEVVENGKKRTLRNVGEKWSYLQRSKFGANTQPFYVLLDAKGMPLTRSYSYDKDISHYLDFLNKGLEKARKKSK